MNVVLVGEEAAGMRTLLSLQQCGVWVIAVMASPSRQNGAEGLRHLATKLGYTIWPLALVKDPRFAGQVHGEKVDVRLNVHWLLLIRKAVLGAPRLGGFHLHPGSLPRYAGLNSVSWAICQSEKEHGVTLHRMVPEIDAGHVVFQKSVDVGSEETGLPLTAKCLDAGVPLLLRLLEAAARGPFHIPSIPQDLSKRDYFGHGVPENGIWSWDRPAGHIVDFVRASNFFPFRSPWGVPRAKRGDTTLGILKARLTGTPADAPPGTLRIQRSGGVEVACADERIQVRQVFREGTCIPPREALKTGDHLADV